MNEYLPELTKYYSYKKPMNITQQEAYLFLNVIHVSMFGDHEPLPVVLASSTGEGVKMVVDFLDKIREHHPEVETKYPKLYKELDSVR